jgi:hypothetical protein
MRRLVLSISILLGAACTPGAGEYGSCITTADCQVNLFCKPTDGLVVDNDAGNPVPADGGICRLQCGESLETCPDHGEVCGANGYCSKDGGY